MTTSPLDIKLKRNANISFKVVPKFCKCGRPMFLKKGQDKNIFWACKGFHPDESVCVCDLTKDVKCFKCDGEIRKKENKNTGEIFYGCTNYSTISESGCNFTLDPIDMDDVIKQVNDALKFRFNFRSTQFDSGDERIWDKYQETHKESIDNEKDITNKELTSNTNHDKKEKVETKWWFNIIQLILNKKKADKKSEKSYLGIPPNILKYVIIGMFIMLSMGIISGAGIEASFFQGMFTFSIHQPKQATGDNIAVNFDKTGDKITIENTTEEKIDLSSVKIMDNEGNEIIDLDKLPESKKIINPKNELVINKEEIENLLTNTYTNLIKDEEDGMSLVEPIPEEKYSIDKIFNELANGSLRVVTNIKDNIQQVKTKLNNRFIDYRNEIKDISICDKDDDCDGDIDETQINEKETRPIIPIRRLATKKPISSEIELK